MINETYVLNERFKIIPVSNEIISLTDGEVIKLEPRVMRVLCLLISKPNEVIERKDLIHEIWEDYGGADESLTQAISHLRKILDSGIDQNEESLIETITKKGYRITARVDLIDPYHISDLKNKRHIRILYAIIAGLILLLITILFLCNQSEEGYAPQADSPIQQNQSE